LASTTANASGPCRLNTQSTTLVGSRVQHAAISTPLPNTTPGTSYGGRIARRNSTRTASARDEGSGDEGSGDEGSGAGAASAPSDDRMGANTVPGSAVSRCPP